jgi:hypothetical protein
MSANFKTLSPRPWQRKEQPIGQFTAAHGYTYKAAADWIKEFLHTADPGEVRKYGKRRETRFEMITRNVVRIAMSPTSPLAISAYNALMDRAYGRPKPSEEEVDAIKSGGFQLVFVQRPEVDPEIEQAKEKALPKPDFIPGEFREEE